MYKPPPVIVAYTGPSMLDGMPIVCLLTLDSTNSKTGPMVQSWIMRADERPSDASKHADDSSVCGSCPRRHSLGGDCYVLVHNAPQSTWKAWERAGRPFANWTEHTGKLRSAAQSHGLRMGSYGDPAAVPHTVWQSLLSTLEPKLHTGYTHQWRSVTGDHASWLRRNVMASADSSTDISAALLDRWRYFAALPPNAATPTGAVECMATRERNPLTCEQCGICNGTQDKATRTSVYLVEHGARSGKKHKSLGVVQ